METHKIDLFECDVTTQLEELKKEIKEDMQNLILAHALLDNYDEE